MGPEGHHGKNRRADLKLIQKPGPPFFGGAVPGVATISSPPPSTPYSFAHPYVSAHTRAKIVCILLIVGAILSGASILLSTVGFFFPQTIIGDQEIEDPQVLVLALMQLALGLLEIVVYIATIVTFLLWLHRSYENLPAFGVPKSQLQYSSGWAIGSFFIPFASLVIPYRAIKELWRKSVPNSGDLFGDQSPPPFFPLWWAVWLVSNFANQIYFRVAWRTDLSPEIESLAGMLTALLDLLAAILALMVVREIDRQQLAKEKVMPGLASPHPPPPPVLQPAAP